MKTKKEAIKEAYAQLGLNISLSENNPLEENGLVSLTDIMIMAHKKIRLKDIHEFIQEYFIKTDLGYYPKSLQGIENNNGWIKIRSEADLPKEVGEYFIITNDNMILVSHYSAKYKNFSECANQYITHYQPIDKPKPPIY